MTPLARPRPRTAPAALVLFALVLLPAAEAGAQEWIENRSYTEGIGIKLGSSMVFHPGLGVEAGYDSNVFYDDSAAIGAARLRIVPSLALATLPPQRLELAEGGLTGKKPTVDFRLGFAGIYEDWFGKSAYLDKRRDFGINTDFQLTLFPFGKFRLLVYDDFTRMIRPPNGGSTRKNYTLDHNTAGLGFRIVPGEALEIGLDYRYNLNFYEYDPIRDAGNYHLHDIEVGLKWKFLPKTALVFKGLVNPIQRWSNVYATGGESFGIYNGVSFQAMVGLSGLFTPRFGIAFLIGYGGGFYDGGDDFDSVVANGELRFFVTPMSVIRAGFIRDIRPSFFANYYERNEGYVSYEQLIVGRVLLSAKLRLGYWKYATMYQADGETPSTAIDPNPRVDWPVVSAIGFAEYRITDWIAINATFAYTLDKTETTIISPTWGDLRESYWKIEVFGGVRAMY